MADSNPESPLGVVGSVATNAVGDQPTMDDALGFTSYVEAIAAFLTSAATKPPLTMSIEGEWGSGKSSFMLQLERVIRGPSRWDVFLRELPASMGGSTARGKFSRAARLALRQRQQITIRFNAWRHDKQDALWAAFALKFTKSLRKQVGPVAGWAGDLLLLLKRLKGVKGWAEVILLVVSGVCFALGIAGLYRFVNHHPLQDIRSVATALTAESKEASVPAPVAPKGQGAAGNSGQPEQTGVGSRPVQLPWPYEFLFSKGRWGALLVLAFGGLVKFHRQFRLPISVDLEKYLAKPNYESRVAFIEGFHEDFSRVVSAYAKNRRIYIFIDDLDRCDVPRAAELVQAINLMIGDAGNLVFVLGMDREKVAAGITQKYKDMLQFIPEFTPSPAGSTVPPLYFGYSYLEKFIQLSFAIPVMSGSAALDQFLSSMAPQSGPSGWRQRLSVHWSSRLSSVWRLLRPGSVGMPDSSQLKAAASQATDSNTVAQQERVKYRRVEVERDSGTILRTVAMVAPIFENNPRRLKQFINAFRLALYLCSEHGVLDQRGDVNPVTFEQLGKFVALMIRFPHLRSKLGGNPSLLTESEQHILGGTNPQPAWFREPGVKEVLQFGVFSKNEPFDPAIYSLVNFPATKLLSILPRVPVQTSAQTDSKPDMPEGVARSATLSFEVRSPSSVEMPRAPSSDGGASTASSAIESAHFRGEGAGTETDVPEDTEIHAATSKGEDGTLRRQAYDQIDSRLARLDPGARPAYEEALHLLLREGSANEDFVLRLLKGQGLASNWVSIFPGMQTRTNLVRPVPGQSEKIREEQKEWQIKPELRPVVEVYLQVKGKSSQAL